MKSNVTDILGVIHHQTEKAVLFSDTGCRDDAVWLPKSAIEFEPTGAIDHVELTLPVSMAQEKGLI
jgi:hypothetical protein